MKRMFNVQFSQSEYEKCCRLCGLSVLSHSTTNKYLANSIKSWSAFPRLYIVYLPWLNLMNSIPLFHSNVTVLHRKTWVTSPTDNPFPRNWERTLVRGYFGSKNLPACFSLPWAKPFFCWSSFMSSPNGHWLVFLTSLTCQCQYSAAFFC